MTSASHSAPHSEPKPHLPPGTRRFGAINWLGLWTLYLKEVRRFMKVGIQTIAAPVITTLLFLAVFSLALGRLRPAIDGVPFVDFIAPGLIMMSVIQNAFANSSSSMLSSKVQGNVVDVLMPPLSPGEINMAYAMGGMTRGMIVAVATATAMIAFVNISVTHIWAVVFYAAVASLLMSLLGLLGGIWAEKFDHMQALNTFVITPFAFLSGTFYSVKQLPGPVYAASQYNPFFYMIDGFRYGITGHADGSLWVGVIYLSAITGFLWFACHRALKTGWKLKA